MSAIATPNWGPKSSIRLQDEVEGLLRAFRGFNPVKELFWELLGYDRRDEAISLSALRPDIRSWVMEAQLLASHGQFQIYALTVAAAGLTPPVF